VIVVPDNRLVIVFHLLLECISRYVDHSDLFRLRLVRIALPFFDRFCSAPALCRTISIDP
jgi:hypothetical protein